MRRYTVPMSYSVTALTSTRLIDLRTNSASEVRAVANQARSEGAQTVEVAHDGRAISEMDLARLAAALTGGSSTTRYA